MSKIYVCDICGAETEKEGTELGKGWADYGHNLHGKDACNDCFGELKKAFFSWDEVIAIRQKNIDATLARLTPPQKEKKVADNH